MTSTLGRSSRWLLGPLVAAATLAFCLTAFAASASAFHPPATMVTADSAKLNAYVAGGEGATYYFEYGTDTSYGTNAPAEPQPVTEPFAEVSEQVQGLEPGVTYHYRIVNTTEEGTYFGEDQTFTTEPLEVQDASGEACSPVSVEGATVSGGCLVEGLRAAHEQTINGMRGCKINLNDMRIGGNGELYVFGTNVEVVGDCLFVGVCTDESSEQVPWRGQVKAIGEGDYAVDLEICVEFTVFGQEERETIRTSLDGIDAATLEMSQDGYSEEGDLLHGGEWSTWQHDFSIEDLG